MTTTRTYSRTGNSDGQSYTSEALMNIDSLKSEFRGKLLTPGSDGYDAARRLWNGMIDRRPAVIAQSTGPDDVMRRCASPRERTSIRPFALEATTSPDSRRSTMDLSSTSHR